MQGIRVYEMPACKMVSSGLGMYGEEKFDRFGEWVSSRKRGMYPRDFLSMSEDGLTWVYMLEDGMIAPSGYEVIDFPGGMYAVATDVYQQTDAGSMIADMNSFLEENGLERDLSRRNFGSIITSPLVHDIIGYEQMDYYIPVKAKEEEIPE